MSIKVCGTYSLDKRNLSMKDEVKIAYSLISLSVEFEIGLILGGNSTFQSSDKMSIECSQTRFNISDDPLDNSAECLFAGDGIKVIVGNVRVDFGESLENRMLKLQNFFKKSFDIKFITNFELNINIEDGDVFETREINVDNFKDEMLKLYEQEDNWTPVVKLIIARH